MNNGLIAVYGDWDGLAEPLRVPRAHGLKLNISEVDNAMDLALAQSVAPYFRVSVEQAEEIISNQIHVVSQWRTIADSLSISHREQQQMEGAFRLAVHA